MKFKKTLIIGIDQISLSSLAWKKIENLSTEIIRIPKDSPKLLTEIHDADSLLVNFGVPVTREMMDKAPQLKYVGILATAFGKVDIVHAKKKKIIVSNLAGYSTESVAEFVIAVILETMRGLEEGKRRGRVGNVSEMGISAFELKGKTFGVIGLGNIGGRVAEIALGFGARVVYYSRKRKTLLEKKGAKYVPLNTLVKTADVMSLNLAQAKETEKILNVERLAAMKKESSW